MTFSSYELVITPREEGMVSLIEFLFGYGQTNVAVEWMHIE